MRGEGERAKNVRKMRNVKKRKEVIAERWKKETSGKGDVERHGNGIAEKEHLGANLLFPRIIGNNFASSRWMDFGAVIQAGERTAVLFARFHVVHFSSSLAPSPMLSADYFVHKECVPSPGFTSDVFASLR